jgi:hypothetical protein
MGKKLEIILFRQIKKIYTKLQVLLTNGKRFFLFFNNETTTNNNNTLEHIICMESHWWSTYKRLSEWGMRMTITETKKQRVLIFN